MEAVFFLLILCSQLPSIASSLSDTLKQGDVLNASDESILLVSANGTFTLGFFTPAGKTGAYLAIRVSSFNNGWIKPVWIGNRDAPLPTIYSVSFHIDVSGRLVLTHTDGFQDSLYLLSSKQTTRTVAATLLDSGNLVLREVNTDGSFGEELWSSFDNPTDTLLLGMKLGVNHRTGRNWSLTSWQDDDNPAAGPNSLEWEPKKRRLVIKYRGVVRWTSGELMNATDFQHISGTPYYFFSISTKEEDYFSCGLFTLDPYLPSELSWRLDPLGVLNIVSKTGSTMDLGECYGYESETQQSKGCELWEQPKCRGDNNNNGQTFEERTGRFVYHTENGALPIQSIPIYNSSYSPSDCREYCWNDCDCVGYSMLRSNNEGVCECWMGTYLQFEEDTTGNAVESVYVLNPPAKGMGVMEQRCSVTTSGSIINKQFVWHEEQLRRCINVGLLCVEDSAVDRPSMADVVSMFTNENLALPKPKKPAFVSRFGVSDTFQDDQSRKFTVNELSISTMEAR
nr:G-type lectin S-receptor-like serine/threonine-protein kinase At1g67520 isoform X1 [Ipomoea trifida]